MKINGIEYVIEVHNGSKFYYKMVDGKKIELTTAELIELQKDLARMQQVNQIREDIINKINDKSLNSIQQIYDYIDRMNIGEYKEQILDEIRNYLKNIEIDQIKSMLLNAIKTKSITNYKELEEFLKEYDLKEDKEELLKYGKEELDKINLNITPIEEFKKFIKEEYQKAMMHNSKFKVDFSLKDSMESKYFEVSLFGEIDGKFSEYNKNYYVRFDENTHENLILPIIREIASQGIEHNDYYKREDDFVNNRYNYHLNSFKNVDVSVKNVEQFYADELKKTANQIEREYGINNNEETLEEIEENYSNTDDFTYEELEDMKAQNLTAEEYRKLHKSGPVLVRKKPDSNNGFVNSIYLFMFIEFISCLFILMQIILL